MNEILLLFKRFVLNAIHIRSTLERDEIKRKVVGAMVISSAFAMAVAFQNCSSKSTPPGYNDPGSICADDPGHASCKVEEQTCDENANQMKCVNSCYEDADINFCPEVCIYYPDQHFCEEDIVVPCEIDDTQVQCVVDGSWKEVLYFNPATNWTHFVSYDAFNKKFEITTQAYNELYTYFDESGLTHYETFSKTYEFSLNELKNGKPFDNQGEVCIEHLFVQSAEAIWAPGTQEEHIREFQTKVAYCKRGPQLLIRSKARSKVKGTKWNNNKLASSHWPTDYKNLHERPLIIDRTDN